ncbi:hypothetical protein GCM10011494_24450 [Novosphingobium endophyticum]|uniref:Uncharacterized protein n=1 Tax=Novosphingobium endophyticum TaxID=1955250 RepID=A0A916TT43_9SPHN|nr:hypothetical protein GCM10011494_24450 [Novosphingobium endophyticum]
MGAQHGDRARHAGIGREQGTREAAIAAQGEEAPQRKDLQLGRNEAFETKSQEHGLFTGKAPVQDIEPDTLPAIGQRNMLTPFAARYAGKPRRDRVEAETVGMSGIGRQGLDRNRARIEIGMPDDPGRRRIAVRIFGESEAPTRAARCAPRRLRGWRGHAIRRSRDRA